jgi:hypothetical protein
MQKVLLFCVAGLLATNCGGCRAIAALLSPSIWEIKIPAEYKLADNKPKKLLILVEQPAWATSEANMRLYLTEALGTYLVEKIGIKPETVVAYQELADMRSKNPDFATLSPVAAGKALDAQMVLYVVIDDFGLYGLSDAGYYKGQLVTRSGLYDVSTGRPLWPESGELKTNSVIVEVQKGQGKAAMRLAGAEAKCIVRYFYDCPKPDFRVSDEQKKESLQGSQL